MNIAVTLLTMLALWLSITTVSIYGRMPVVVALRRLQYNLWVLIFAVFVFAGYYVSR